MEIPNIPGEVTAAGYLNAIQVDEWSWAITAPGGTSVHPVFSQAQVKIPLSRAIPPLLGAAAA
jgi:hypothetical protein